MSRRRDATADGSASPRHSARDGATLVAVACALGAAFGAFLFVLLEATPGRHANDFTQIWRAGRILLDGGNPYREIVPAGAYPYRDHLGYPLPAAVVGIPFALLPAPAAGALFGALGSGALAYVVLRDAERRLLWVASASFILALALCQWSPLLTAAALLPPLGVFAVCKPNIGLALFARRPTTWMAGGGLALVAVSFAFVPSWPLDWLDTVRRMPYYASPVTVAGGPVLLLAALRWRDPDARLLLALALVPSNLIVYDQLPLLLVTRSRRQSAMLVAGSYAAYLVGHAVTADSGVVAAEEHWRTRIPVIVFLFLPALWMVLSRPSPTGQADWTDRVLNRRLGAPLGADRSSAAEPASVA